jgi:predicted Rossmann fold flavoprotein
MKDVCVIGGGPAGMMCAGRAAERGLSVLLLEKNDRLGKKLDITGGGRCNITNATFDNRQLAMVYGNKAKFLHSAFAQHSVQDTIDHFNKYGIEIVQQARGRCFPASECAPDVTAAMRRYVNETGRVETKLKHSVINITKNNDYFEIKTKDANFKSANVVIAAGGTSHPETGSTGDGFDLLDSLGHSVKEPNPNLVPLRVRQDELTAAVSGNSLSFMKIRFWQNDRVEFSQTGKVLFTHFGLSGPLILNSSYQVSQMLQKGPVFATIDMYPDTELPDLDQQILNTFQHNQNKLFRNVVKELVPTGMSDLFLTKYPNTWHKQVINSFTRDQRRTIVDDLKGLRLEIIGNMGDDWAVIADGGVDLREIDTKTMQSKIIPGLYAIGDVLHVNRPSGGYSLQLIWTTGWVAGNNIN